MFEPDLICGNCGDIVERKAHFLPGGTFDPDAVRRGPWDGHLRKHNRERGTEGDVPKDRVPDIRECANCHVTNEHKEVKFRHAEPGVINYETNLCTTCSCYNSKHGVNRPAHLIEASALKSAICICANAAITDDHRVIARVMAKPNVTNYKTSLCRSCDSWRRRHNGERKQSSQFTHLGS